MQADILTPCTSAVSVPVGTLFEANGSVATAMYVSKFRTMTIDQFKEEVVPTLKSSPAEGTFHYYIIRDLSGGRYITVQPDGVTELMVNGLKEVPVEDLIHEIKKAGTARDTVFKRYMVNSPLPVYYVAEGEGFWEIAVKTPETKFKYISDYTEDLTIYMPPSVYVLRCTEKNLYVSSRLYVLVKDSIDPRKVALARPCLPNISDTCNICVGRTRFTDNSEVSLKPIQCVAAGWELLLGSTWNSDYKWSSKFPSNLYEVADKTELDYTGINIDGPRYPGMTGETGWEHRMRTILALLKIPGKWEELNWPVTKIGGTYNDSASF